MHSYVDELPEDKKADYIVTSEQIWNDWTDKDKIAILENRIKEVRWYLDWLMNDIGQGMVMYSLYIKLKMIKDKTAYRGIPPT